MVYLRLTLSWTRKFQIKVDQYMTNSFEPSDIYFLWIAFASVSDATFLWHTLSKVTTFAAQHFIISKSSRLPFACLNTNITYNCFRRFYTVWSGTRIALNKVKCSSVTWLQDFIKYPRHAVTLKCCFYMPSTF